MEDQSSISEFFLQILSGSPATAVILWNLPGHVSCHLDWEPTHHPGHRLWPPPPHTHVILSGNLSFVDMSLTSSTVKKMLVNVQTQIHSISYAGCLTQMYFFLMFGDLDSFFLAVVAYDHYMAICCPLHYSTVICESLPCACLMLGLHPRCCPHSHPPHGSAVLLCCWGNSSLSLWHNSSPEAVLFWYLHEQIDGFCLRRHSGHCSLSVHCHLLCTHWSCHTESLNSCWGMQSLFHLQFPYLYCLCVLWDPLQCLLVPSFCCLWREGLCSSCNIHSGDPHVETLYLQPKEQGHEGYP